ncbi:DNA polymerase delta subunit 2 [Caerostris darwini]|uniref:DNA polymerase delta subunit 2 n=1 Tax=Caerostris darwini TaxID=1538125 RepID=A0AAV4WWF4_9ARAC|nr:DNA polymerase delta subunit 2 [Caerostris darwini]
MIPNNQSFCNDTSTYVRPSSSYICNCNKFLVQDLTFERQYATLYTSRLRISTELLQRQINKKWGPSANVKKLCDITGDEKVVVIGTIFKHMELHPSILKEISDEHHMVPEPVTEEYTKEDDFLILEDDLQRVVLCGNIDPQSNVTGINVAVLGYTEESGKFFVEEYCHPSVADPEIIYSPSIDKYVVLVSGFSLNGNSGIFPVQLLIDYITGQVGGNEDQKKFSQVVRVIIAGNSIGKEKKRSSNKSKLLARKVKSETAESMAILDRLISELVSSVSVDIMPGEFDPANHLLPQQPLHPAMFPKSSKYATFNVVTNPYEAVIDGIRFLGSSGQNVKNIRAFSKITEPLDVMQKMLDWGHMSPTAPDSLNCYPFLNEDPFIISQYPHVYFCGNSPKMGYRFSDNKSVMMIAIPEFQQTNCVLMLNLRTLEVQPIIVL